MAVAKFRAGEAASYKGMLVHITGCRQGNADEGEYMYTGNTLTAGGVITGSIYAESELEKPKEKKCKHCGHIERVFDAYKPKKLGR